MNFPPVSFRVHVDPANPGQFFACCGLAEIAEKISPGVECWFEGNEFHVSAKCGLKDVLTTLQTIQLEETENEELNDEEDDDDSEDAETEPIIITTPFRFRLDWWSNKSLKTWAGSMKAGMILSAMCGAVDPENADPFYQQQVVYDPINVSTQKKKAKPKKREPFYFDSRRGNNSNSIDVGFRTDKLMLVTAYPAVESLCLIGLQRCRPIPASLPRQFVYYAWSNPSQLVTMSAAVAGVLEVRDNSQAYTFVNIFRTGQEKHKAFSSATAYKKSLL